MWGRRERERERNLRLFLCRLVVLGKCLVDVGQDALEGVSDERPGRRVRRKRSRQRPTSPPGGS